jgi:hypothetical protein
MDTGGSCLSYEFRSGMYFFLNNRRKALLASLSGETNKILILFFMISSIVIAKVLADKFPDKEAAGIFGGKCKSWS